MDEALLENFIALILTHTGIHIRSQDKSLLAKKLSDRSRALSYSRLSSYYALLANGGDRDSQQEWKVLASVITTGESYFFRDQGQITLLQERILPELMTTHSEDRRLNILSAGCSSGEEVYSLAILLKELIPYIHNWNISLVGLDLNQEAIAKAKEGLYSEWSFRGVEPARRSHYFQRTAQGWQVIPELQKMVEFRCANLIQDGITCFAHESVDLIICRNVFIYFDRDRISLVLKKFIDLLKPKGYLLTGHTELQGQIVEPLQILSFPESVIYQHSPHPPEILPAPTPSQPLIPANTWERAQDAFSQGNYGDAIRLSKDWLKLNPKDDQTLSLIAQAAANQGKYAAAIDTCHQILAIAPTSSSALFLLAQIAESQGDIDKAKEYLRRILFLDPNSIPAYLELLELHARDRESGQAQRLLETAAALLQERPDTDIIPYRQGVTVATLRTHLEQLLKSL